MTQKTFSIKPSEIKKSWLLIDAKDKVLGRMATQISLLMRGKNKATYTQHMDDGSNIIVINSKHVKLTGKKADKKDGRIHYRHTGYPGGIKSTTTGKLLDKHPNRVIEMAVSRMLPKNKLSHKLMGNLYIYSGPDHIHSAQQPVEYHIQDKKHSK